MSRLVLLRPAQRGLWMDALSQSAQHDFYHLAEYHALEEEREQGTAYLLVYSEGGYLIALPLMLRSIERISGLEEAGRGLQDATSVYGYAGPVASAAEVPAAVLAGFHRTVREALADLRVVAVFSRLHPLLPQPPLLSGLGGCQLTGQTVSIDLTLPPDVQRACYRKNIRAQIRRLEQSGISCVHVPLSERLGEFVDLYHATMRRVRASEFYFFERSYFERLASLLAGRVHLCVALKQGTAIATGLSTTCGGIMQQHLAGTRDEYVKRSPLKLVSDAERLWAGRQGLRVCHLGGGLSGREDDLFVFKAGFSDRRHPFFTWRWCLSRKAYESLCVEKQKWNQRHDFMPAVDDYFPEYRSPTVGSRGPRNANQAVPP